MSIELRNIYKTFGAYAYSTELWSLWGQAGIEPKNLIDYMRERTEDDDVAMLAQSARAGSDRFPARAQFRLRAQPENLLPPGPGRGSRCHHHDPS